MAKAHDFFCFITHVHTHTHIHGRPADTHTGMLFRSFWDNINLGRVLNMVHAWLMFMLTDADPLSLSYNRLNISKLPHAFYEIPKEMDYPPLGGTGAFFELYEAK